MYELKYIAVGTEEENKITFKTCRLAMKYIDEHKNEISEGSVEGENNFIFSFKFNTK